MINKIKDFVFIIKYNLLMFKLHKLHKYQLYIPITSSKSSNEYIESVSDKIWSYYELFWIFCLNYTIYVLCDNSCKSNCNKPFVIIFNRNYNSDSVIYRIYNYLFFNKVKGILKEYKTIE